MRSWWFALATVVPPAVLYARTMAPGLLSRGDVPKFQFLGEVLGTAHAPGYPLFVQLSWLASQVPVGSVAWRVNAMTACFGVAAAAVAAWTARRAGASRPAALLAAWGLASGPVFWEQATAAEVYTLAVLLQAAALGLTLRWSATRRDTHLIQAVAVSALALGHHPTFAMSAPALAAFVLVTDWRVLTRWRVMAGSAALLTAGVAQYAFIIARSTSDSPYLEARATSLTELIEVLRGTQYQTSLFAFSLRDAVVNRLPLLWQWLAAELGWAGLALAAAGWIVLLWAAWRQALLFGLASVMVFGFALSYDVPDIHVFVVPVMLCWWIVAAVGLDRIARRIGGHAGPVLAAAVSAAVLTAAMSRSYTARDLHADTEDREYVEALLAGIATPATLLFDTYDPLSHALRYMLYAERTGHRIRIGYAAESENPRTDYVGDRAVYANEPARAILSSRGLWLSPVEFDVRLTDQRRKLPESALWIVALPEGAAAFLSDDDVQFLRSLGFDRMPMREAVVAFSQRGTVIRQAAGLSPAVSLTAGWGESQAGVSAEDAWWRSTGVELRAKSAALVAAIGPAGEVLFSTPLNRSTGPRPTFETGRRPFFKVVGTSPCALTSRQQPVQLGPDGHLGVGTRVAAWVPVRSVRPFRRLAASIVVYAGSASAPVRLAGQALDAETPLTVGVDVYDRSVPADAEALRSRSVEDGASDLPVQRFVTRALLDWTGSTGAPAGVAASTVLSHRPDAVMAVGRGPNPVQVCAPPVEGVALFGDPSEWRWEAVRHNSEAIGEGWHAVDDSGGQRLRWMSQGKAGVRFTLAAAQPLAVRLTARPLRVRPGDEVDVIVNGTPLGAMPVRDGVQTYEWRVPRESWREGYNEIVVSGPTPESPSAAGLGSDVRALGLGVTELAVVRGRR